MKRILISIIVTTASIGSADSGHVANMGLYAQEQSNWCWAAVTQTVAKKFNHFKPQCRMGSRFIKKQPGDYCCQNNRAGTAECNQGFALNESLGHYQMLSNYTAGRYTQAVLVSFTKAQKPVPMRIGWSGGGGHFLIIYGADSNGTVSLWDPLPVKKGEKVIISRSNLETKYKGTGSWTHSYNVNNPG